MISYREAFDLTLVNIQPLGSEIIDLLDGNGRAVAKSLSSRVDSPSLDVSLKDGYAVHSMEIENATPDNPVIQRVLGTVAAGGKWEVVIRPGEAVRILSGAPIPAGANAVVAEEFVEWEGDTIRVMNNAHPGRNILIKGSDVKKGEVLVSEGELLYPTRIGWLAAAGYHQLPTYKKPRVVIMATGDEVIAPGETMSEGKIFASNLVTLAAWCRKFGFETHTMVVPDDEVSIHKNLFTCLNEYDAVLSSGGAWKGERDLIVHLLDEMGWNKIYHRVRIGPGKAIGFGLYQGKTIFCLPGGPPSNHMAFLQLALPGLHKLAGWKEPGLPRVTACLMETISGQIDWSQFIHGRLEQDQTGLVFIPLNLKSRLQMMADTDGIVKIPEGVEVIQGGAQVPVQMLR